MISLVRLPLRLGAGLSLIAALPLVAAAQDTTQAPVRLSLGEAVQMAARQNATAQVAALRVQESQARVRQAQSALLPQLSATASDIRNTMNTAQFGLSLPGFDPNGQVIGPINLMDARAHAQLSLYNQSAIDRVRAAKTAVAASGASARDASELAAVQAAAAYLRATRAEAQLLARQEDSVLAADLLNVAQQQLRAGVGVALDVTRAQAQLAGVRAQLIAARGERDRAQLDLLRALSLPLNTPLVLTDTLTAMTLGAPGAAFDPDSAVALALATRPDVQALDAQLRAQQQQITAINAERLPTVGLFGDDGFNGKNASHLLNTYTVGVQLTLPVFTGFNRQGRVQEQQAVYNELQVQRRDLTAQVGTEVRGAIVDLMTARQQVDAARERLRLAEQEVSQARERFRAGVAGNADVTTASLNLTEARTQYNDALTAYQTARVNLARAEGTATQLR